jgi:hypothetical protein
MLAQATGFRVGGNPPLKTRDELKEELGKLLAQPFVDQSQAARIHELGEELDADGVAVFDKGTASMISRARAFPLWRVVTSTY